MPTILLARHAQASFGAADYDVLSPTGHEQAQVLANALAARGVRLDRVVCGSLRRQRDTLGPVVAALGGELETDPRWDEYDTDDILTHHATTSVRPNRAPDSTAPSLSSRDFQGLLDAALLDWIAGGEDGPARQPWPAFADRAWAAVEALAHDLPSGTTALACTSGGVLAALTVRLLGVPAATFPTFNRVAVNGGLTKLVSGRSGLTVISFNEHAHLEEAGRPLVTYR